MSNFEQISDVLMHHHDLHGRLAEFYASLAQSVSNPRASMLLQTLSGHEQKMTAELDAYQSQASSRLLNTYFQYSHEHSVDDLFELPKDNKQLTADDIYDASLKFDNYLSNFYDEMIETADIGEVKDMFSNLRAQIEEEKKRLSIDMAGLMDM